MQVGSINLNKESKNIQWNDSVLSEVGEIGHMLKSEAGPLVYTTHKIDSKWITNVNLRLKVIKLLGENISGRLLDIGLGNDVLNLTPKRIKAKINKWDYIKLKSFCTVKKTINKMKTQPTE